MEDLEVSQALGLWQSDVGGLIVDAILSPSFGKDYSLELSALARVEQINATHELAV
jgi:hypothetical protein